MDREYEGTEGVAELLVAGDDEQENRRRARNRAFREAATWSFWSGLAVFFIFETLFAAFGAIQGFDLGNVKGMPQLPDIGIFGGDLLLSLAFALGVVALVFLGIMIGRYAHYKADNYAALYDVEWAEEHDMTFLQRNFPIAIALAPWLALVAGISTIAILGGFGTTAETGPAIASLARMSSAGGFSGELVTAGIVMLATFVAVLIIAVVALAVMRPREEQHVFLDDADGKEISNQSMNNPNFRDPPKANSHLPQRGNAGDPTLFSGWVGAENPAAPNAPRPATGADAYPQNQPYVPPAGEFQF